MATLPGPIVPRNSFRPTALIIIVLVLAAASGVDPRPADLPMSLGDLAVGGSGRNIATRKLSKSDRSSENVNQSDRAVSSLSAPISGRLHGDRIDLMELAIERLSSKLSSLAESVQSRLFPRWKLFASQWPEVAE